MGKGGDIKFSLSCERNLDDAQDMILGVDYLPNIKAVLNITERTLSTQQCREANAVFFVTDYVADDICSTSCKAAALPITNLNESLFAFDAHH